MLIQLLVLFISGFFIAVAGCGVFVWFYNRYLSKMHETPIKKIIALTVLPAGCLFGLLGGIRLGWMESNVIETALWILPVVVGVVVTGHFGYIHLSNRKYKKYSRFETVYPVQDQINWPYIPKSGALVLKLLAPINRVTRLRVHHRSVILKGLPENFRGYRVAHITDIHIHPTLTAQWYRRVVCETMRQKPDMVLFGGDFISRWKYTKHIPTFAHGLKATDGVWFVRGNHDFWKGPCRITRLAKGAGLQLLSNEGTVVKRGESELSIIGLDEPYISISPQQRQALRQLPHPRIALVHTPDAYASAAELGCQFALAGHTHGGQVRLPFFGTTVSGTNAGVRAADGAGSVNGMQTLTSNGQGAFFPLRVLCPPEIVVLTLEPEP